MCKIAVALVHGIGKQTPNFADPLIEALQRELREKGVAPDDIVFRSVYWAPVLSERERALWREVTAETRLAYGGLRRFVVDFLGDAVAYQPSASRHQVYERIHGVVAEALRQLAAEAGSNAPLCVVASSLGTVIAHNYFYDLNYPETFSEPSPKETALEQGRTLALFVATGSPLALWRLRYGEDYAPITFPGTDLSLRYPDATPKWLNLFDKDDVLAYPIGNLSEAHRNLVSSGLLEDRQVNVGGLLVNWNPLSHSAYWGDRDVIRPLTEQLTALWQAVKS